MKSNFGELLSHSRTNTRINKTESSRGCDDDDDDDSVHSRETIGERSSFGAKVTHQAER